MARREKITIARLAIPAAVLSRVAEPETKLSHQDIVQGLRTLRKRVKPGKMSVREMIDEGLRF